MNLEEPLNNLFVYVLECTSQFDLYTPYIFWFVPLGGNP